MRQILNNIYIFLSGFLLSVFRIPFYCVDLFKFISNYKDKGRFEIYPILGDNTGKTIFDRHYIYHVAWAARKLREINPKFHVDISSTLYFSSIVSAFIPVKFYDYRPACLYISDFDSGFADLTKLNFKTDSINCLSCMHTIEHIGLGRYGDEIDPFGDIKAIKEIKRVLSPGGNLLLVVPVGSEEIVMFNAHRIYTVSKILDLFKDFKLKEFTLIPEKSEDGGLVKNPSRKLISRQRYGCGCFWFQKRR